MSPSIDEMMGEVEAQHDVLLYLGFQLSYVDEHMGVGKVAGLASRPADFAEERGLVYDRKLTEARSIVPLPGWSRLGEHPGMELADRLAVVPAGTYLLVGHPGFKSNEIERLAIPGQPPGRGPDAAQPRPAHVRRHRDHRLLRDTPRRALALLPARVRPTRRAYAECRAFSIIDATAARSSRTGRSTSRTWSRCRPRSPRMTS